MIFDIKALSRFTFFIFASKDRAMAVDKAEGIVLRSFPGPGKD